MNRSLWYMSLVFVILGLAGIAAGMIIKELRSRKTGLRGHAMARVVELRNIESDDGINGQFFNRIYPMLEFYADGKLYKVMYPFGSYPSRWELNQKVPVIFNPDDPNDFELSDRSIKGILPFGLYVAGICLLMAGALAFISFAHRG